MASWAGVFQPTIDAGRIKHVALVSKADGVIWGTTDGFELREEVLDSIKSAFPPKGDPDRKTPRFTGLCLRDENEKYINFGLEEEEEENGIDTIRMVKGRDGAILAELKTGVLVALYEGPVVVQEALPDVTSLATYLRGQNF